MMLFSGMKLLSGRIAQKKFLLPTLAAAAIVIGLSPLALAENEKAAHAGTEPALQCLLHSGEKGCEQVFVGPANILAVRWVRMSPWPNFGLGALDSAKYDHTISGASAYDIKFLNGQAADVFDVKFAHQEMTFYITLPEADGKIRHLLIRNGAPDDERGDLFSHGPG